MESILIPFSLMADIIKLSFSPPGLSRHSAMVKLGSNLSDKPEKQQSAEDGLDNVPLITPLEVSQLQQKFAEKVMVRTSAQFQLQQKRKTRRKKMNINFYRSVSDKAKITGLILISLAFMTGLLLLLMYKAMWYDQLTCPEGFVLKQNHCSPKVLEMFYTEQQEPGTPSRTSAGLIAALSHIDQLKRTGLEPPAYGVLKESSSEPPQRVLRGEA
uniref:Calcyon neuron-specific vesicular protein n=1 Tax=Oryzias latipes TaxID=8090 RepID=A0A3P9MF89_ORYLA